MKIQKKVKSSNKNLNTLKQIGKILGKRPKENIIDAAQRVVDELKSCKDWGGQPSP